MNESLLFGSAKMGMTIDRVQHRTVLNTSINQSIEPVDVAKSIPIAIGSIGSFPSFSYATSFVDDSTVSIHKQTTSAEVGLQVIEFKGNVLIGVIDTPENMRGPSTAYDLNYSETFSLSQILGVTDFDQNKVMYFLQVYLGNVNANIVGSFVDTSNPASDQFRFEATHSNSVNREAYKCWFVYDLS